jgi:hypothetical protein
MTMILLFDPAGTPQDKIDAASGGHVEHLEAGALLNREDGPEHQELLRLIGALVETNQYGEPSTDDQL